MALLLHHDGHAQDVADAVQILSVYSVVMMCTFELTAREVQYITHEPQLPGITLSRSGGSQKRRRGLSWEA